MRPTIGRSSGSHLELSIREPTVHVFFSHFPLCKLFFALNADFNSRVAKGQSWPRSNSFLVLTAHCYRPKLSGQCPKANLVASSQAIGKAQATRVQHQTQITNGPSGPGTKVGRDEPAQLDPGESAFRHTPRDQSCSVRPRSNPSPRPLRKRNKTGHGYGGALPNLDYTTQFRAHLTVRRDRPQRW